MVSGSFLWVPISPGIMFCLCSSSVRLVLIATNCGDWQHLLYIVSALPVRPLGGVCWCLVRPVGYIMPGRSAACNRSCGASVGDFQPMPFSLVFSRCFIVFGIQWVNMPVKVKRPFYAVKMLLKIDLGRCSYIWPGSDRGGSSPRLGGAVLHAVYCTFFLAVF